MPITQNRLIALVEAASDMLGRIDTLRLVNRQDKPIQLLETAYHVAGRESPIAAETIHALCAALRIRFEIIANELEPGQAARTTIAAEAGHFRRVGQANARKALYQKAKRIEGRDPYTGPQISFAPVPAPTLAPVPAPAPAPKPRPMREDPAEIERLRQNQSTKHADEEPIFKAKIDPGPEPEIEPETKPSAPGRKLDYGAVADIPPDDVLYAPPLAGPIL